MISNDHFGYSTTYGVFSGFEGVIRLDVKTPANSSVEVTFPVRSMLTVWETRFEHFVAADLAPLHRW